MNEKTIATYLSTKPGILGVRVEAVGAAAQCHAVTRDGAEDLRLKGAAQLFGLYSHATPFRVAAEHAGGGGQTIACFCEGKDTVVVVMIPTGHTIAKSLGRMVRRACAAARTGKLSDRADAAA